MKVVTVVGTRPQFIKAAVVSRAIAEHNKKISSDSFNIEEIIIHTGQHFEHTMSDRFFDELSLPQPKYNLGVCDSIHGVMTGRMLERIEEILIRKIPDLVIVYGDTNSTLAGALAASKLHIPVAHVEAGLRSFDRRMPEEINRLVTDHVSTFLFCPTHIAIENLKREGITTHCEGESEHPFKTESNATFSPPVAPATYYHIYHVGDVMYDACLYYNTVAKSKSRILDRLGIKSNAYILATIHRAENTDNPSRLQSIFEGFSRVANELPVVIPLHPRTRDALERERLTTSAWKNLKVTEPVGYLDMIMLEKNARIILTDSGGVQKEAFFFQVPCLTLRERTEWKELVNAGWNVLVDADNERMYTEVKQKLFGKSLPTTHPDFYGTGNAGATIIAIIKGHLMEAVHV